MNYSLSIAEICAIIGGRCTFGNSTALVRIGRKITGAKTAVSGVSTDTRTLEKGDLFFALTGENFDANKFVVQAARNGAAACVVSQIPENLPDTFNAAIILVRDVKTALAALAAAHRNRAGKNVQIASVAGSCGKTTVKQMLASILNQAGQTTYSYGNFNNEIGCPLSLLNLQESDRYGLFEIGSSAKGEVDRLSKMVRPHLALITNIYLEHTLTFGTLQDIAEGESEILLNIVEQGAAILPQEDGMLNYLKSRVPRGRDIFTFGFTPAADVFVESIDGSRLTLVQQKNGRMAQRFETEIPVLGRHNVLNACAAACAALALNVPIEKIQFGLKTFTPERMRFEITQSRAGITLVNDSYNSNPGSLRAALQSFAESFPRAKKYVVLGDMLELGDFSKDEHEALAPVLAALNLESIFLCGPQSQFTANALKRLKPDQKLFYAPQSEGLEPKLKELNEQAKTQEKESVAMLFKASRGMQLEKLIKEL